jgi:hypothetical protein
MKLVIAFASLLLISFPIQAQTEASSPESTWAGPPVVKDAPYFADIISTYDRTTLSGEHKHREMHSKVFRDTQGRTRRDIEQTYPSTGQTWVGVLIMDPVSNTIISLDSRTKTARIRSASINALSKPPAPSKPESVPPPPEASSVVSEPAKPAAPPSVSKVEELGTRIMEGLTVKGTKITTPLPPAPEGNEQPRTLVTSTWISNELHIEVLKEIDEVSENHRTVRLVNIVRTEPDAELFKIPSGYTVVDSRTSSKTN